MIRSHLKFQILSLVLIASFLFLFVPDAKASVSDTLTSQDVNQSFTINWSYNVKGGTLDATGIFTLESINANGLVLNADIKNTSKLTSSLTQSAMMSLGIATSTPVTPSLSSSSAFNQVVTPTNGNFPGGFKNFFGVSIR
ncbi:MAG: hypothetical protein ACYCTV_05890 [Leptospirales bacterium]